MITDGRGVGSGRRSHLSNLFLSLLRRRSRATKSSGDGVELFAREDRFLAEKLFDLANEGFWIDRRSGVFVVVGYRCSTGNAVAAGENRAKLLEITQFLRLSIGEKDAHAE